VMSFKSSVAPKEIPTPDIERTLMYPWGWGR
jgi:hypothetical protein